MFSSDGRASVLHAEGHWFDPNNTYQTWPLSSVWLERLPVTQEVAGSSPVGVAKKNLTNLIQFDILFLCVDDRKAR